MLKPTEFAQQERNITRNDGVFQAARVSDAIQGFRFARRKQMEDAGYNAEQGLIETESIAITATTSTDAKNATPKDTAPNAILDTR